MEQRFLLVPSSTYTKAAILAAEIQTLSRGTSISYALRLDTLSTESDALASEIYLSLLQIPIWIRLASSTTYIKAATPAVEISKLPRGIVIFLVLIPHI